MARILLVDDDPTAVRFLSLALESEGHHVRCATAPQEAIDAARQQRPDVLITDWLLRNEMDGSHVVERVREINPDTQVVVITGLGLDDVRPALDDVPAVSFFSKPLNLDELIACLPPGER